MENARVVILVAEGRVFTSGLDLKEYGELFNFSALDMGKFIKM